jgi:uncharacterized protein DUF4265
MADQPQMARVLLPNDDGNVERLWATPVGHNQYRLENSPFYAYRVSWMDIVEAQPVAPDEWPTFLRIVEKSGHRTVRLILDPPVNVSADSQQILDTLTAMNCTWEGATQSYFAIDIPADADFDAVRQYLITTGQQWEHADPAYADLYPEDEM